MQVSKWGTSLAIRLPAVIVEALNLKEGDEIVTGSYKTLRTIRNGASIKIDNSTPKKSEES